MEFAAEWLNIELVEGGFELDGFLNFIHSAMNKHPINPTIKSYNLLTIATHCDDPSSDKILWNKQDMKNNKGTFPKQVIVWDVRLSNKSTCKKILDQLASFLNETNIKNKNWSPNHNKKNTQKSNQFIVQENFDHTSVTANELKKLDYNLISRAIIKIIQETYDNISATWTQENPSLAEQFFSKPYLKHNIQHL